MNSWLITPGYILWMKINFKDDHSFFNVIVNGFLSTFYTIHSQDCLINFSPFILTRIVGIQTIGNDQSNLRLN
jgi:hypothetical protein